MKVKKILNEIDPRLVGLIDKRIKEQDANSDFDAKVRYAKNNNPEDFIKCVFLWHETKEGVFYWNSINNLFKEKWSKK